ncbi:MAG: protein kinase [Chloroflexi bacterium]|nr:protein kinase [Chloroflexota bacterium]
MYEFLPIGYMLRGRYRILRVIGGGGMGAVYKSEDTRYNSALVAVKEMRTDIDAQGAHHPETESEDERAREREERRQLLEAFRREAQILSDLHHSNLPRVTDFFTEGGRPYLVMELIPGESLEKRLDRLRGQALDEAETLQYGIQVSAVLHFLHTQEPPIIFRDVKPANIMVMPNGYVKLIDFGIARTYKEGKRRDTMSMGTAAYAPFEQFGKGQTDARSDIYSLAATMYHLLTGRPPTPATTPTNLRDFNPNITANTEKLIIQAMSRDMDARPQSAIAFEQELRRCLGKPFVAPINENAAEASAYVLKSAQGTPQKTSGVPDVIDAQKTPVATPASAPTATQPQPHSSAIRPIASIIPPSGAVAAESHAQAGSAGKVAPLSAPHQPATPQPVVQPVDGSSHAEEERVCMVCGTSNQGKAHFCGRCGASLAGRPAGRLQVLGPNGVLWERRILENPFNIGRRSLSRQVFPHLDLTYNDPAAYVSRQHARIVADAGGYFIEDLGSANGTFLNDRRLPPNVPTRLRNGDRVRIGKAQVNFILGG